MDKHRAVLLKQEFLMHLQYIHAICFKSTPDNASWWMIYTLVWNDADITWPACTDVADVFVKQEETCLITHKNVFLIFALFVKVYVCIWSEMFCRGDMAFLFKSGQNVSYQIWSFRPPEVFLWATACIACSAEFVIVVNALITQNLEVSEFISLKFLITEKLV